MPTKPDPVNDLPPPWGGAGNYPATNYPATLPDLSGQANPLIGPTPWSSQPRLNTTGLTSYANVGFEPQVPNDPSPYNEWLRRVQTWSEWVSLGTSADDADAHVVESDALGIVSAQKFQATLGYCNAGITSAVMLAGATIPNGENLDLVGSAEIVGVATTVATLGVVELLSGGAVPSATGLAVNAGGELFWGPSLRTHNSPNGYVYATGDQVAETLMAGLHQVAVTTVAVKGVSAGNVRVIVEGQIQIALGLIGNQHILKVQHDQAGWTDIVVNQTITATKDVADPTDWQRFRHERVFAAGTATLTKYRCEVTTGGGNSKVKEVNLRVVNERG